MLRSGPSPLTSSLPILALMLTESDLPSSLVSFPLPSGGLRGQKGPFEIHMQLLGPLVPCPRTVPSSMDRGRSF